MHGQEEAKQLSQGRMKTLLKNYPALCIAVLVGFTIYFSSWLILSIESSDRLVEANYLIIMKNHLGERIGYRVTGFNISDKEGINTSLLFWTDDVKIIKSMPVEDPIPMGFGKNRNQWGLVEEAFGCNMVEYPEPGPEYKFTKASIDLSTQKQYNGKKEDSETVTPEKVPRN